MIDDHRCIIVGVRDKRGAGGRVTSHRKDQSSAQRLLQPGEDMEAVVADALVFSLFFFLSVFVTALNFTISFCCVYLFVHLSPVRISPAYSV